MADKTIWAVVATSARNSVAKVGEDGVAAIATNVAFTAVGSPNDGR